MFLLDTNACIYYLNGSDPELVRRIVDAGPDALAVSALTAGDLYLGAERSTRKMENRGRLTIFFSEIKILGFDEECGKLFGRLKADLLSRGRPIPDFDIGIAATAIAHGRTLVSRDAHMAEIPHLLREDWSRS